MASTTAKTIALIKAFGGGHGGETHICSQNEYDSTTLVPTVSSPDPNTFYLVPSASGSSPNLYTEWIYANNAWEMFGQVSVADVPVEAGSAAGSVQTKSFVSGASTATQVASGAGAFAEGNQTTASGNNSHAEGKNTTASGTNSHAEGSFTIAAGSTSHAEGAGSTASGAASHAEGTFTIAAGSFSHVSGGYNVEDSYSNWSEWVSGTSYEVGDKVKVTTIANDVTTVEAYICKTANSDASFTAANWTPQSGKMNYIEIVGNGTAPSSRSNARALDWDGNAYYKGDVYVECDADSSGGTRLPKDVQVNGQSVVSDGVANVPIASTSSPGVVKMLSGSGMLMNGSTLLIANATVAETKAGSSLYAPIVAGNQHNAAFYGLAKAAGDSTQSASGNAVGTYTETAKSSIASMLNAPETISGSTPSITAKAGVRYICGECSTLTIVTPASGIVDVIFESGTTPTVLTVTPPSGMTMHWANDFDPTALEASTTYEVNIMDGVYGVVGEWT